MRLHAHYAEILKRYKSKNPVFPKGAEGYTALRALVAPDQLRPPMTVALA